MKKTWLALFTIWMIVMTQSIYAADPSDELSALLSPVRTMEANFAQTVNDNRGKVLQRTSGKMAVARPGKFRWEVKKPSPQLIIANGSKLWIYDPDLQQVTVRALDKATGDTPALLLTQVDVVLQKNYRVTKLPQNNSAWQWFSLKPKGSDNMFASVQMGFLNGQIRQMRLQDHLDHNTNIQFINPRLNGPLSSSTFAFKAPRNVDVIDETRKKR